MENWFHNFLVIYKSGTPERGQMTSVKMIGKKNGHL